MRVDRYALQLFVLELRQQGDIVQLDPTFDNPLSYVAKVNADRLKEGEAKETETGAEAPQAQRHAKDVEKGHPVFHRAGLWTSEYKF